MKTYKSKLSKIGSQLSLRLDMKYRSFWDGDREIIAGENIENKKIGDLIKRITIKKVTKKTFGEDSYILNISDTIPKYGKLEDSIQLIDEIGSDKTILDEAEIIVSKLCMGKGYIFSNESKMTNLIGSTELIPYIRRDSKVNLIFLRNLLLIDEYLKVYESLETGKTPSQKRVNPIDFLNLPVINVPSNIQDYIGKKVLSAEKHIRKLKKSLCDKNAVIDEVFCSEFGIDINEIKNIQKPHAFTKSLSDIALSFDLRNSTKYFSSIYYKLETKLLDLPTKPLKLFLEIPIKLGASISPSDFDDGGVAYYISMATIKSWSFNKTSGNKVSDEFFEENQKKSSVRKGDIIIARSGEGTIGKVALITDDIKGVFADFTMRIRLSEEVDKRYFYYYFCSSMFQLLIEKEKKGLGNNTNIFPRQLKYFPVIFTNVNEQKRIADLIDERLSKIQKVEKSIISTRKKIDGMIRSSLQK